MPATSWRLTCRHLAEAAHHLAEARLQRGRRARVASADHEGLVAADVHDVVLEELRHLTQQLRQRGEGDIGRGIVVQLVTVLVMRFALLSARSSLELSEECNPGAGNGRASLVLRWRSGKTPRRACRGMRWRRRPAGADPARALEDPEPPHQLGVRLDGQL